jgi:PIN domain nuclease of toxin-antitoxin system
VVLAQPFETVVASTLQRNDIALLDISLDHATRYVSLPLHHRDPSDRIIIAQALVTDLTVISNDTALDRYGIDRRW